MLVIETQRTKILREKIAELVEEYASITQSKQPFLPGLTAIPPSGKTLGAEEIKYMVEASLDGWLTSGRFLSLIHI